ncbi:hypothetical protein AGMMS49936_04430 [Endomicrobiia bacterium]|nr:hypothetical protein AGMMS49936_04430 [Endomicrobiia bacterium]
MHTNTLVPKRRSKKYSKLTKEDKKFNQRSTRVTKEDKEFNQINTQKLTKEDKELNREISSDDEDLVKNS